MKGRQIDGKMVCFLMHMMEYIQICITVADDIEVFNGCAGETSVRSKCKYGDTKIKINESP